jgi:hypothetical protein
VPSRKTAISFFEERVDLRIFIDSGCIFSVWYEDQFGRDQSGRGQWAMSELSSILGRPMNSSSAFYSLPARFYRNRHASSMTMDRWMQFTKRPSWKNPRKRSADHNWAILRGWLFLWKITNYLWKRSIMRVLAPGSKQHRGFVDAWGSHLLA